MLPACAHTRVQARIRFNMRVFMQVQQRASRFWQENLPACVAFFFFLSLGAACGYAACRELFGQTLLLQAQSLLAEQIAPRCLLMLAFAILSELAWASCILFTGLQRFTVPLWMLCIAARGFAAGAATALCALVGSMALWTALVLSQSLTLLAALRLATFAIRNLRGTGRGRSFRPPLSPEAYLSRGLQLGSTLLVLAVLEATLLPLCLFALLNI